MPELAAAALRIPAPPQLDERPFVIHLIPDEQDATVAAASIVAGLAGPDVRVVRAGNPLRSPLTLDRILIQVSGPDGVVQGSDASLLVRAIAERQAQETRVVLLVEQAETIHPKVLRSLQAMAPFFVQAGSPALQVVFVGRPSFRDLLDGEQLPLLRAALDAGPPAMPPIAEPALRSDSAGHQVPKIEAAASLEPPAPVRVSDARAVPPRYSRAGLIRALLLVMVALGTVWVAYAGLRALFYRASPAPPRAISTITAPTSPSVPQSTPAIPDLSGPSGAPAMSPIPATPPVPNLGAPAVTPPASDDEIRLRKEFDAFLSSAGRNVSTLSDAQRSTLFQEYLEWRARTAPNR